jgi:hypothetical protein
MKTSYLFFILDSRTKNRLIPAPAEAKGDQRPLIYREQVSAKLLDAPRDAVADQGHFLWESNR